MADGGVDRPPHSNEKLTITTVPTPDKPIGKPDAFTAVAGRTLQHTPLENGLTRYMYTADGVTRRYDHEDTGDFTLWWSQDPELGVVAATYKVTNFVKQEFRFGPRQGEQLKEGSYGPTVDVTNPLHASRPGMSIWGMLPDGRSLVGGQFKVLQFVPGQTKPSRLGVEWSSADGSRKGSLYISYGPDTNVLANDFDPDVDPLSATLVSGVKHGKLVFNADGTFAYTPDIGFLGRDSFTYQPTDGKDHGNTTTVNIDVVPPLANSAIRGQVFNDGDGDGVWGYGERGIAGRTVFVDANLNGVRDAGEKSAVTAADGSYTLEGLPAGTHRVTHVIPSGWRGTSSGVTYLDVALRDDQTVINRNLSQTQRARIAGTVFMDANVDGVMNGAEGGIPGWRVFLDRDGDAILDIGEVSVVTDPAGRYAFDNVEPGTHSVRVAEWANYFATVPSAGQRSVTVAAGQSIGGRHFGQKRRPRNVAPVTPAQPLSVSPTAPPGFTPIDNVNKTPVGTGYSPLLSVNNRLVLEIVGNNTQHGLFATDGVETVQLLPGGFGEPGKVTAVAGTTAFFMFYHRTANVWQLWRTDGTAAGTAHVKDIGTDNSSGDYVNHMTAVGNRVVFAIREGGGVWCSDGTPEGTAPVTGAATAWNGFTMVGDRAYFMSGGVFWSSDGTVAGTTKLDGFAPGQPITGHLNPIQATAFGESVAFINNYREFVEREGVLCVFDGTSARVVQDPQGRTLSGVTSLIGVGATLFAGTTTGLWAIDRSFTQWTLVGDPGARCLGAVGNSVIFAQHNGLWSSDGVLTHRLPKYTGVLDSHIAPVNVGRRLMVAAGKDVWITDGTPDGTVLLASDTSSLSPFEPLFDVNGIPYFTMRGGLRSSDGTPQGTAKVSNLIQSHDAGSDPSDFTAVGDAVYFVANDGVHGRELWRTDVSGTRLVRDIKLSSSSSAPGQLTEVNDRIVFIADDGAHGRQLWSSEGTEAGTQRLSSVTRFGNDIAPGPPLVRMDNYVYFAADDGTHGRELWRTDGTVAGTTMVSDIRSASGSSFPSQLTVMGDRLYFTASATDGDVELWRTDGTAAGTNRVFDARPGAAGSGPQNLTASGRWLYFTADDGMHGRELWRSDGTQTGTSLVADLNTSSTTNGGSTTFEKMVAGAAGRVVFTAKTTSTSNRGGVWSSDGTAAGTRALLPVNHLGYDELTNVNGLVYFVNGGYSIWRTDGTAAGTVRASIDNGPFGSSSQDLTPVGNLLYFTAYAPGIGWELWVADARGLHLVADLNPALNSSNPTNLTNVNGSLMFAADDGFNASEPWRLDVPRIGTIGGSVFNDANGDGARSEPGVEGFRVFIDTDNDGAWDKGEPFSFSSGSNGWFEFPEVPAGRHWLRVSQGKGWRETTSVGYRVVVDSGDIVIRHFGVTRNVLIFGSVFLDANLSGGKDAGEAGLAGWTVFADADDDGMLDPDEVSVRTDALGRYAIRTLAGGTHRIRVLQDPNYRRTAPAAGFRDVSLLPGAVVTRVNFGQERIE